jgi:3-hydroxyacyl-CoA dehydrogenase/enoyl-CoA hydratase/3-hydroxybutyryl-CoA epimerase
MVTEGIPAEAIDKAATSFGMPMGPIELADTVGLDICRNVAAILSNTLGLALPADLNHMVEEGHLGKKSGRGFYIWNNGKVIKNKKVHYGSLQEIQDRLVFRLLNEALACWRESIVDGEDQIDAGVIFGTGFAPFRGGPLRHIHNEGHNKLHSKLIELEKNFGERFRADEAWDRLTAE